MDGNIPALRTMKPPRNTPGSGAFTLFEMIVVVVIFVLLAGGIYATVNAAVRASATLADENLRTQRINAFIGLVRRTLHNLPATATLSGGVRSDGGKSVPEIVLREAPGVFAWGSGTGASGLVLLSARPRLGGGREFSLLSLPSEPGANELNLALERGNWLRLLPDVREAKWRFFSQDADEWFDEWPADGTRPALLELNFELLGEEIPRTYVFWVPPVKEAQTAPNGAVPVPTPPPDNFTP
jgi:prepilin-type N-terminal cleavage/methylation domain-containing protein